MAVTEVASNAAALLSQIRSQADVCWVCLGESTVCEPLTCPCRCPRPVHSACLARWQLHSAGTREETHCRFCDGCLPDWKPILTPSAEDVAKASPTMSVTFNGQVHFVTVKGGPNGYADFVRDIQSIFGITTEHDMQLAFDCADPLTGQLLKLNGAGAYQAAVHCATISAAKRLRSLTRQRRPSQPLSIPPHTLTEAASQIQSPPTPERHMHGSHPCWD